MPERLVIVKTTPLYYLHLAGHLDLLKVLYGSIIVPPAVQAELEAGAQAKLDVPRIASFPWIQVKEVQARALLPAIVDLGPGEAEVIALGLEHPGSLLILDDKLARRVAAFSHLTYTGTMGVVLKGKQAGHLKAIRPVIESLRASGLWLHGELVAMALAQAGE
jgi:predicted nucleic acid-binding protein